MLAWAPYQDSPVTLVSFGETTVVMDGCVEGEEEMEEEDTLESTDSNMYDFTQPPLTPATHSGAQPQPLHHHHHLNGVGSTTVANGGGPVALNYVPIDLSLPMSHRLSLPLLTSPHWWIVPPWKCRFLSLITRLVAFCLPSLRLCSMRRLASSSITCIACSPHPPCSHCFILSVTPAEHP
eukprot:Em0113g17a